MSATFMYSECANMLVICLCLCACAIACKITVLPIDSCLLIYILKNNLCSGKTKLPGGSNALCDTLCHCEM
jgi:hypothetical protein